MAILNHQALIALKQRNEKVQTHGWPTATIRDLIETCLHLSKQKKKFQHLATKRKMLLQQILENTKQHLTTTQQEDTDAQEQDERD